MNNTRQRHDEIQQAAKRLLEGHDLDTSATQPQLIDALISATGCHKDTAKRHLAQAARLLRGEAVKQWGGVRPGGGWPKGKPRGGWKARRRKGTGV